MFLSGNLVGATEGGGSEAEREEGQGIRSTRGARQQDHSTCQAKFVHLLIAAYFY